jgi:DNA mismatch endonuclease (patch repair protein)
MPDNLTPDQRRRSMQRVRNKDTNLEVAVRSELHRRGYRFRKHLRSVPGSPDVVFTRAKVAVFVDGDFWHGYRFDDWKDTLSPFWSAKIAKNIARDVKTDAELEARGWLVVRVWQHEIKADLSSVVQRIIDVVNMALRR